MHGNRVVVTLTIFIAVMVSGYTARQCPVNHRVNVPSETVVTHQLGITPVNISTFSLLDRNGKSSWSFLNLHQNENTSVWAAKSLIASEGGGSIVYLSHGGQRRVAFRVSTSDPTVFSIDPNRMFTPEGIAMDMQPRYDRTASDQIASFAEHVLQVYGFYDAKQVVALHNNGPHYSALDYLPNGTYAADAQAVHIGALMNPRMFFYISDTNVSTPWYHCLTEEDFNAVLQADINSTLVNDGSLSVFSAMHNKPYVNIEAAAENGSGDRMIEQLIMLDHFTDLIEIGDNDEAIHERTHHKRH